MKRRRRLAGLIRPEGKDSNERGSIVLEAAMVTPLLMMVLVVFIVLIRLCAAQMALQSAASQTARQAAAHIYPVELAIQQTSAQISGLQPMNMPMSQWSEVAAGAAEWLPDPVGDTLSAALRGDWQPFADAAATEIGKAVIEPLLQQNADEAIIESERISLSGLTLPDLQNKEKPYLSIEAQYDFPLSIPFTGKKIRLQEQATERVWVSDAASATDDGAESEAAAVPIQIISITPNPLRPGQKATVVALTSPGASVSLEVMYKSGKSEAKHLGNATADENGYVQWTWHVSGNTTPGVWELTAISASGERVSMHFSVEKKAKNS
ncbi:TadE family protein [Paenibacillus sp. NEAU-GSW1]|uniref:TadE family protein n=1 Tax=Paenibacillus sp. NEAU-GSW1 TaxID=2682486 RepID=UPI0012E318AD|nr:TadE family protein [Paenibacillus sp. NEAU-GSW1]MUT68070.1 hypothetical protein [Paenibacillus sp. NEAU-GSW1]